MDAPLVNRCSTAAASIDDVRLSPSVNSVWASLSLSLSLSLSRFSGAISGMTTVGGMEIGQKFDFSLSPDFLRSDSTDRRHGLGPVVVSQSHNPST